MNLWHKIVEERAEIMDDWFIALLAFASVSLLMLFYLFAHKSAPDSYARSKYVIVIKLKMVVAITIPLALVTLVLGVAYWLGGLLGLLVPLAALVLVLELIRMSTRSEPSYALSQEQSPGLHSLVAEVSGKIRLKKKPEICLCRGCQAHTYGWLKPRVALGIPLFDYLTVGEIKAVVAHELGHIKDGDYAVGAFFTMVLTSLKSMTSACKQAVLAGGSVLLSILMGIAGIFVWALAGFVRIVCLLFMRQGEFMADVHAIAFESETKPTNFGRGLGKTALLSIAEAEFEKRVLTERVLAVRQGRFPISKLFEKPHIDRFYQWLRLVGFSPSDEMIEKISESKRGLMRNWASTHPPVGDRIRNLEVLMSKYPMENERSQGNDTSARAAVLIQEVYDDAVKFLYRYESFDDELLTQAGVSANYKCSRCGKRITLEGEDSFFDTLEDGQIVCQNCLDAEKTE